MESGKKEFLVNSILFVSSTALILLLVEMILRVLVTPADNAYGLLFGERLPPLDVVPWSRVRSTEEMLARRKQWARELVVGGKRINFDDLGAVVREDPVIGYVPEENLVSSNGWYLTNSIGARSRSEFTRDVPDGKIRVILFGDSFTSGLGLPQDETWAHHLEAKSEKLELANFGVGGYGMGQSYLHYLQVREKIEGNYVFLMIVPSHDLFRDINVIRSIANKHWDSHKTNARFIIEDGELKLIPSLYETINDMIYDNRNGASNKLIAHLEKYESYYYPPVYRNNSAPGGSILYKLLLLVLNNNHNDSLKRIMMEPGSESMRINRRVFHDMGESVNSDGARFVVIVLPRKKDIPKYNYRPGFHRQWNEMVDYFRSDEYLLWNLMEEFQHVDTDDLDYAYDNIHYGPRAAQYIADFIWARFSELEK